jgi:hypothetical protein
MHMVDKDIWVKCVDFVKHWCFEVVAHLIVKLER